MVLYISSTKTLYSYILYSIQRAFFCNTCMRRHQRYISYLSVLLIIFRFIVPVSMIVINDVMAYMFGFFFGRTPLIKLSPKKTWEGFIGGGISTVILGLLVIYGKEKSIVPF